MRVCCFRVFVDGELWDCLLIIKRNRHYVFYPIIDKLPFQVSAEFHALQLNNVCDPEPITMDANCLECVINTMKVSDTFQQSVVRKMNVFGTIDNNNIVVSVKDIRLMMPRKYRLAYTWCEIYEKTDIEYRELENIMAWLSTLGGAFSSLGDKTEQCAIIAGKISVQQLKIAMRIGDPLTVTRCKLYAAISLMQRGLYKQAKSIVQSQYIFIKSQIIVDERLLKMCYGIWTKLKYERNQSKSLGTNVKKKKVFGPIK